MVSHSAPGLALALKSAIWRQSNQPPAARTMGPCSPDSCDHVWFASVMMVGAARNAKPRTRGHAPPKLRSNGRERLAASVVIRSDLVQHRTHDTCVVRFQLPRQDLHVVHQTAV